tara:strand:- start:974 stop:1381 length:408 start_codon:yes stop_codon:yes gene_type:complete
MKKKTLLKKSKATKSEKKKSFEIKFYESIIRERPDFIGALIPLADAYTKADFYREGLVVDKKLSALKPADPVVHYNLACSLSLTGKPKEALGALKKAVLLGYSDFKYILGDSDLVSLRELPEFGTFFSKLKKLKV